MTKDPRKPTTLIHSLPTRQRTETAPRQDGRVVKRSAASQPGAHLQPSAEEIGRRAYEIFLRRGGHHGRDMDDWLQAEAELRTQGQRTLRPSTTR
ncbi:MAG: DUF2934 domain-containing protein [Acidobacteria bacterium]|nr:DUF2934 domain-containing protein [Acidobacteriota bacterium]